MSLRLGPIALAAATAAAAAAAALPGPAAAVDSTKPAPCGTVAFKDPAGDSVSPDPTGLGELESQGPDNTDVLRGWMNTRNGETTANIEIKNLTQDIPPEATGGLWYYMMFADDKFVRAAVQTTGITYAYGQYDSSTGVYTTEGETTGVLFEGENGVVQIVVPADVATPGAKLAAVRADADYIIGTDDVTGLNAHSDEGPDDDGPGKSYTVEECGAQPPAPGGDDPAPPAALPLRTPVVIKKAKKGKRLKLRVQATEPITGLKLGIYKASGTGKALASVSAASLSGSKTLKLKVRRSIKKGRRFVLRATGTAGGAERSLTVRVKAR